ELTMVPRDEDMYLHLTGTDFYEKIEDEAFERTREYWDQQLVSETKEVYRGEYLAACMLFDAEQAKGGLSVAELMETARDDKGLVEAVRAYAADRYDEGYERGLHDADTAKILEKLLAVRQTAGLLRFAPAPRAWACLFWAKLEDQKLRAALHRRCQSLGRLRRAFKSPDAEAALDGDLADAVRAFLE
ncbi:MAG: DNA repair protein, partial [Myxococcales bacterium]|nr:DNA repair protein [Myxococcales bacterium]